VNRLEWHDLKAAELRALAARDAIVIVPVGSTEQHGPHLPVQVDALLAGEVACRAARLMGERQSVVVAPTIWTGLAEHHMAYGGTITLDFQTFHAVLRCVCDSILRHGFRRILLLNGHGGNIAAMTVIVGELRRELKATIATATYWTLPGAVEAFATILERQQNVRHACEAETSMLLHLKPELVDAEVMRSLETPTKGLLDQGGVYRWRSFTEVTESGVIGVPAAASAEKGERLLNAAAESLVEALINDDIWPAN
jgi:creatinine amidohydrolase